MSVSIIPGGCDHVWDDPPPFVGYKHIHTYYMDGFD